LSCGGEEIMIEMFIFSYYNERSKKIVRPCLFSVSWGKISKKDGEFE
jgi:hypothetical protein